MPNTYPNTENNTPQKQKRYWWKAIVSFVMVLLMMPLGHAMMKLMEILLPPAPLHYAGFAIGVVGLIMVIIGVFVKGDTRQTIWGLIGGLLVWTGWVEFLFMYYANRYGTQPQLDPVTGQVITKPEYLIMPATFGLWMMVMMLYIFSTRNGCNFINWWQRRLFGKNKTKIAARPMTRHNSIITFMEIMMILWTSYLLLMFCYDEEFIGDHHPVTYLVGIACFVGSLFIFKKQLRIASWGYNIRMSVATVIVFWTPVEILGRNNFLNEIWLSPLNHKWELGLTLLFFAVLIIYLIYKEKKRKPSAR